MGRPRTISDERILETARAAFLEHGPRVATGSIAERLGLSQAALFKRFGTKEELLIAALRPNVPPAWHALAAAGPDDRDVAAQLRELAEQIAAFFAEMVPCMAVLRASGISYDKLFDGHEISPPLVSQQAVAGWFRRAQARGRIGRGDPEAMALLFIGSLHAATFFRHLRGPESAAAEEPLPIDEIIDLFCRGTSPA